MGAWNYGPFDNDDAGDWLSEFEDRGIEAIQSAFDAAMEEDYLESTEGSAAVAAAAILAAIRDKKIDFVPEEYRSSIAQLSLDEDEAEDICSSAIAALDRVMADDSELKELWSEADEFSDWKKSITDIRKRLI